MYALGGKCLKSARANPRSTSLADTYANMEMKKVNKAVEPSASGLTITTGSVTMRAKGNAAIGIIVTAKDATRQSFCSG